MNNSVRTDVISQSNADAKRSKPLRELTAPVIPPLIAVTHQYNASEPSKATLNSSESRDFNCKIKPIPEKSSKPNSQMMSKSGTGIYDFLFEK